MTSASQPPQASQAPRAPSPSIGEVLDEVLPLVFAVPVAGPAIVVLLGPWLVLVLMLVGCFTVLATVAAVIIAALGIVRLVRAGLATPHRIIRRLWANGWSPRPSTPRLIAGASR